MDYLTGQLTKLQLEVGRTHGQAEQMRRQVQSLTICGNVLLKVILYFEWKSKTSASVHCQDPFNSYSSFSTLSC